MNSYIYSEIGKPFPTNARTVDFPTACPKCNAETTGDGDDFSGPAYACGGQYTHKSQIQNHTDYWWGLCPIGQEASRKEHGRVCDGCGDKRLEGRGFPVECFPWTCKACNHRHAPVKGGG